MVGAVRLRAWLRLRRWRAARRARIRRVRFAACAHRMTYIDDGPEGPDTISVDYRCRRCGGLYMVWLGPGMPVARWLP